MAAAMRLGLLTDELSSSSVPPESVMPDEEQIAPPLPESDQHAAADRGQIAVGVRAGEGQRAGAAHGQPAADAQHRARRRR